MSIDWKKMSREELQKASEDHYEFHLIPDGDCYVGIFPSLPGCAAIGKDMEETLAKAQENKRAWFLALLLNAVDPDELKSVEVFAEDDPAMVEEEVTIAAPTAEDLAITDSVINEGDAIILVEDERMRLEEIIRELEEKGYAFEDLAMSDDYGCIFVNLYFEVFAPAAAGSRIARPFKNKAVNADDFDMILDIYERNGSLEEGLSEVDQKAIEDAYSDDHEDVTFGQLLEQYREVYLSSQIQNVNAGPADVEIPASWEVEKEADGSGFFCTDDDRGTEFSMYYSSVDLSSYENDQSLQSLRKMYEKNDELTHLRTEEMEADGRKGLRFVYASADQTEVVKAVIVNGQEGILEAEYRIPANSLAYLAEDMEKAVASIVFAKEETE